jgi:Protein of unknown function (DUF2695)
MTNEQLFALFDYLEGPQGCNFQDDERGEATWKCDTTLDMTRAWLRDRGLDEEENIAFLESLGGHCDCEVVFNVTDKVEHLDL